MYIYIFLTYGYCFASKVSRQRPVFVIIYIVKYQRSTILNLIQIFENEKENCVEKPACIFFPFIDTKGNLQEKNVSSLTSVSLH